MSAPQIVDTVQEKPSPYRWVVIITWMTSHIWAFMVIESLGLLLPSMREDLGLTPIQEGLLGGSPLIGYMFLAILASWLLSRFSPKRLTSVTLLIGTAFILFQGWSPVFAVLLLGRFLFGLTTVAREPARSLFIRQWIQPGEIMLANASMNLLWGISAIGFVLIPFILELLDNSWRNTMYLFAGISLLLAFVWQLLGRERITEEYAADIRSRESSPITSIIKYKELWLLGIGVIGVDITFSAMAVFWPSFMLDTYNVSLKVTASVWAISGLVSAAAAMGISILARKADVKRLILVLCGVVVTASSIGMLFTGSIVYLVLLGVANGLSFVFFPILMTIPFELPGIKPREVAVANGFIDTFFVAGAMLGPILAGVLQEASGSLRTALVVTSFFALTLTACGLLLPRSLDARAKAS